MAKTTQKTFVTIDQNGPVECLGMTFPNDQARRDYFLGKLKEKLKDPEFRKIEGFPIGEDDDILALSDPPYYTACPNPFLKELLSQIGTSYNPEAKQRQEPFASDVSEGKNDRLYNAHAYHTKVPHKAIMRYILHYTQAGDVVFDGFGGTGMTGVAASLCALASEVESLGFSTRKDGTIVGPEGQKVSRLGIRYAILNDLSPFATFIAYNYTSSAVRDLFESATRNIKHEAEQECGWLYQTLHKPTASQVELALSALKRNPAKAREEQPKLPWGRINYTVWSDIFLCPECTHPFVFWDAAVDKKKGQVKDEFQCDRCNATLTKRSVQRAFSVYYDKALGRTIRQAKQVPVLINYTVSSKRYEKTPDPFDLNLVEQIESLEIPHWYPSNRMPEGDESRRNDDAGITHVHHFYTKRNLWALSTIISWCKTPQHKMAVLDSYSVTTKMSRFRVPAWVDKTTGPMKGLTAGTLYVPSLPGEQNCFNAFDEKTQMIARSLFNAGGNTYISTHSSTALQLPNNVVDYIFTDPPFGGNLMYSELNFVCEAWLKVMTSNESEAVENKAQDKALVDYQRLMTRCFTEFFRVLKPGRWMTVEFHNSKNSVWHSIQEALEHAGFVVADVRTLDKKQGTFKQVNSAGAVKQDLIISSYKPSEKLEQAFTTSGGGEQGAWEFVRSHLEQLPVFLSKKGKGEIIAERQDYLLYDRMVAFHVQRGARVPLSAAEFYTGLRQKYPVRDGMFFLPTQITEYEARREEIEEVEQLELFVSDERTAIQWVRRRLTESPMTYMDLAPIYMREALKIWENHEQPLELRDILEQCFVKDKDETWRVPDAKREADLEQIRNRALLKEYQHYLESQGKLKIIRTEALRAGFKNSWQKGDYSTIIHMAKRVPEAVIQEDPALLMYYDNALMRKGE